MQAAFRYADPSAARAQIVIEQIAELPDPADSDDPR